MSQQGTLDQLLAALKSVDAFKLKVFNAKTPADLGAAQAGLSRITHEISTKFPEFNNDLIAEFHRSFVESGGTGKVSKNWIDKAYNSRIKSKKGFERATTGMRQWGNDFSQDRSIIEARKAYNAKIAKLQRSGAPPEEIAKARAALEGLPAGKGVSDTPSVTYNRKVNGKLQRVDVPADAYMRMATNSAYAIQRNLGAAAAASKSSGWVIVRDGPACGKVRHDDGEKANGAVWSVEDAFSYPISHPNCTRTFSVSPGPPGGKKTKDLLKEMGLTKQRSGTLHTLEQIAQAAAAAGMVASIGGTIVQNPFVRRFMREIIEDVDINLSPLAQRVITRLQTYGVNEAKAFEQHGAALGASSQDEFNRIVGNSFDDDLANEKFLTADSSERIAISQPQAHVLGLSTRPTKGELLAKLDDYGDWLVHRDAMAKSVEERIQAASNVSHMNEELHRTAALQFHVSPGQGLNAQRNWYNIVHALKKTYDANPDKAERELIRLAAQVLDPTPWLRATLAPNVKFTMGMTSRGRADLAVRIFDKLQGGRALSDIEEAWARQLGMDLSEFSKPESIEVKHIVKALQPRITYQPGGLFSSTLALQNGKLVPIIRVYPDGTFTRFVSLESKLRAGAIEDFIAAMRKGEDLGITERWINALSQVSKEDFITSINLFRNSPLKLSLRMLGVTPDSFAIRALPDNNFLRYSYRFTLDVEQRSLLQTQIRNRLLAGEDIDEIIESISGGAADGTAAVARKEAAKIVKRDMENWVEGFTVLPNLGGGFTLNGISLSQREVLVKMKLLGNNFLIIAKNSRYGYDQILEMWAQTKTLFEEFVKTMKESDLVKVRSFKDATELLGDALRKKTSLIDVISGEDLSQVDISFAGDLYKYPQSLRDDVSKFRLAWERQYPNGPLPNIEIVKDLRNPLEARPGLILIREDVAMDWDIIGGLRRKAVRIGHFPRDTEANVNSLIHEAAHSVILQMSKQERAVLLRKMLATRTWPGGMKFTATDYDFIARRLGQDSFKKAIARGVSGYAVHSPDEFLAEALTEFFGSPEPRAMSAAMGQAFKEMVTGTV